MMTWLESLSISVCARREPRICCNGLKVKNCTSAPVKKITPVQPSTMVLMVRACR